MITHLYSYCDIGTKVHELINEKCLIDFCHEVECIMFNYFETLQYKMVSKLLGKYFRQSKDVIPSELRLVD